MRTPARQFEVEAILLASLTERERAVSRLVAQGFTNQQIGRQLSIRPKTVKTHLDSIFRKLELSSRLELIVICCRHELVVPPAMVSDPT